ncbi:phage shock protein PspA [Salinibius halmophilus]|uniref:phage shock protein PspA n=1 Tax=Salinibius halmophilus TaxID=1853216 RepID=UPI000E66D041|nr:phage shock protein PspA [Salinibius halmophilus]
MGIFSRLTDIVNSNLTALLDKAEDPQKMIRMIIQEMEETLVEVRSSSARLLADRKAIVRRIDRLQAESDDWQAKAKLALERDREDLARAAIAEQQLLQDELEAAQKDMKDVDDHLASLDEEIRQLQTKLDDARAKQKSLVRRVNSVQHKAEVRRQTNRDALERAFERFDHYERRIDRMEGEIEAQDLGRSERSTLEQEFADLQNKDRVDEQLAKMKSEIKKDS